MRKELFALLLVSLIGSAAIDQEYIQNVSKDGSSKIVKTSELSLFSGILSKDALANMDAVCKTTAKIDCSVDVEAKTVTITESFNPGGYYTFDTDFGFPYITNTMTINRVPTDKFANSLERLLILANATEPSQGGSVQPLDIRDAEGNRENVQFLKRFKANLTYTVIFPFPVSEARAGNASGVVDGSTVRFDLVEVLDQSQPMVIVSREVNWGYFVAIAGVAVLAALAVSFFRAKRKMRK
jgi:hypothetical protein